MTETGFQNNLHSLLGWFLSPKSSLISRAEGGYVLRMIANQISSGYRVLADRPVAEGSIQSVAVTTLDPDSYARQDPEYLEPVMRLREAVRSSDTARFVDFIVHGSLASGDYAKGWSDFDTLAILSSEIATDSEALLNLRGEFIGWYQHLLDIDEHQHHGFLVCTELDLRNYLAPYLPPGAINSGLSLLEGSSNDFCIVDTQMAERRTLAARADYFQKVALEGYLDHHEKDGVGLHSHWRGADDALYQFKYLVGSIALAPALLYSSLGHPMNKKAAIESIHPTLSDANSQMLSLTTDLRLRWQQREWPGHRGNAVPEWVQIMFGPNYLQRAADFHSEIANLATLDHGI